MIQIFPVRVAADFKNGDDIASIISAAMRDSGFELHDDDIIIIAQKIVSKAEGRTVNLETIRPSRRATRLAKVHGKDPRLVELMLQDSKRLVRAKGSTIITETHHGFVCANSGIDQSNVGLDSHAVLLPKDSDKSARKFKDAIQKDWGKNVAVIITDTFGRPFRHGQTNVAIGIAGIGPLRSYIGLHDMYGRKLRVSEIAVVDEIASAAELVMGKIDRVPAAIVRGYKFERRSASIKTILREEKKDLFR